MPLGWLVFVFLRQNTAGVVHQAGQLPRFGIAAPALGAHTRAIFTLLPSSYAGNSRRAG